MKTKLLISILILRFTCVAYSQNLIDIANLNVKLSFDQTQDIYYSFDEGDEIVFNFQMKKGRHFKSVEISSSSSILFSEFKAKKIENQRIKIREKGVFRFRFFSSSLTNRVANVRIQRVPSATSSISFNTDWKWNRVLDTTYVPYKKDSLIGYKMISYKETVKELIEDKKEEVLIFQKSQRVHSRTNQNGNKTYLKVNLPKLENTNLRREKILAWAYWIGVGNEGRDAYKKNVRSFSKSIGKIANAYYHTPLAAVAVGAITELIIPNTGHDVAYYFINGFSNVQSFLSNQEFYLFDSGKGAAAFGRNDRQKRTFYIGFFNDNLVKGIDVDVKVVAIKETKVYEYKTYNRQRKGAQYITLNKTRMQVKEIKSRIPVE
ncbi:MAG: hypothetical protein JXR05_12405 [Flavobacteriaceae bacterium]